MNYEHAQIQRVLDDGPDDETGGVFRLKIAGSTTETRWLSVTDAQVKAIQSLLSADACTCDTSAPGIRRRNQTCPDHGPGTCHGFRAGDAFSV